MGATELFQSQPEVGLAQYGKRADESVQNSCVHLPAARMGI
jgi:hypothetical protein